MINKAEMTGRHAAQSTMSSADVQVLLSPAQMGRVDGAAIRSGIDGFALMVNAGEAVAALVLEKFPQAGRVVVLCGPGNNGGDGYIAARALLRCGVGVDVHAYGDPAGLKGDAARAAAAWLQASRCETISPLDAFSPCADDVVVDALFGAGLMRPIDERLAAVMAQIMAAGCPVVAVDLPSGLSGASGQVLGSSVVADHTVTFVAMKPGHLLMPGRERCGAVSVVDIGIPQRFVEAVDARVFLNSPVLWRHHWPMMRAHDHKYGKGHLAVLSGGPSMTGAGRLAAMAGLRAGAGLVTLFSLPAAMLVNAVHMTAVMVRRLDDAGDLENAFVERRIRGFVAGPGLGTQDQAAALIDALAGTGLAGIFDADALSVMAGNRDQWFKRFEQMASGLVITPHEGEFARLFPEIAPAQGTSKIDRAVEAARISGMTVVLKGPDTVVAAPDGRSSLSTNAPPWLATAGSGDVLAGLIGALLTRGMPAFEAAAAGVWLHSEAGSLTGPGLIAEDLPQAVSHTMAAFEAPGRPEVTRPGILAR